MPDNIIGTGVLSEDGDDCLLRTSPPATSPTGKHSMKIHAALLRTIRRKRILTRAQKRRLVFPPPSCKVGNSWDGSWCEARISMLTSSSLFCPLNSTSRWLSTPSYPRFWLPLLLSVSPSSSSPGEKKTETTFYIHENFFLKKGKRKENNNQIDECVTYMIQISA